MNLNSFVEELRLEVRQPRFRVVVEMGFISVQDQLGRWFDPLTAMVFAKTGYRWGAPNWEYVAKQQGLATEEVILLNRAINGYIGPDEAALRHRIASALGLRCERIEEFA